MEADSGHLGTPTLVRNFEAIRIKPKEALSDIHPLPIFGSQEGLTELFDETMKAWVFKYDPVRIKERLLHPTDDSVKKLKDVRKYGIILSDHYLTIDQSQLVPENLVFFLHTLGKYNDNIGLSKRNKYADRLLGDNFLESLKSLDEMNPMSVDDFRTTISRVIGEVRVLSSHQSLIMGDFHRLRKKIRLLGNLFQVPAVRELEGEAHQLFYQIQLISDQLGDRHDLVLQRHIHEGTSYKSQMMAIDKPTEEEINNAVTLVERALGIN
ncbi:MAG: hypothetical protein Q8P65_01455 [bacterium]|nr:hypothetical protein [bacterium]